MKKNIKHLVFKEFVKTVISGFMFYGANLISRISILTNEIALGQMNNSNFDFILFNHLNDIKAFVSGVFNIIGIIMIFSIAYDIFTYIQNNEGDITK